MELISQSLPGPGIDFAQTRKKFIMRYKIIAATMLLLSCTNNADVDNSDTNSTSNIEHHSGENISPQLNRESEDRLGVNDTMSDATETHQEKNNDLE